LVQQKTTNSKNIVTWKQICNQIINLDDSIRFAGICTSMGHLVQFKYKKGLSPIFSKKEAEWAAFLSAVRIQTRTMFEYKLGKLLYSISAYEKVKRITVDLNSNNLLFVSFDITKSEDEILDKLFSLSFFNSKSFQKLKLIDDKKKVKEDMYALGNRTPRIIHEIKNSLSIIQSSIELLSNYNPKQPQKEYERIMRGVNRIDAQIKNIQEFSKIKNINKRLIESSVLFDLVLSDIIHPDDIKIILPKKHLKVYCDLEKLRVAFDNIIINAVHSMDRKGEIKITTTAKKANLIIQFKNSGPEIPKKNLKSIFDPLFTTKPTGVGLGLAITKEIIELHGGKISVKNNPVRFIVSLPNEEKYHE